MISIRGRIIDPDVLAEAMIWMCMQGASEPTSEEDFERLILATPNSSFVWVKFMAWLISLGEVQRARDTAERALNTIHFRCGSSHTRAVVSACGVFPFAVQCRTEDLHIKPQSAALLDCISFAYQPSVANSVPALL